MRIVYLDNAATTNVRPEVLEEMLPYFTEKYGNPSTLYSLGREAKKAVEEARARVAAAINAKPEEIFFTGSGTEADNWAVKGAAYANLKKGKHIITSEIEHHAVLNACKYLEEEGFEVSYIPVDEDGIIRMDKLRNALRSDTSLITIMTANNEIGTIQPISEIAGIAAEKGITFHTDAVQAIGAIKIDVQELNVSMLSMSAHKLHGPKGVGALYIRRGTRITSLIQGGSQETKKRAGTENVPGIVGLGKAINLAAADLEERNIKIKSLRDYLIDKVLSGIPYTRLNGDKKRRLPGNANFSFEFIEGESLLLYLDQKGVSASSGSACTSGSLDPSHVLLAIGLPHELAHGSLRLTLNETNTKDEIDYVLEVLPPIVKRLREMSPLYEKAKRESEV